MGLDPGIVLDHQEGRMLSRAMQTGVTLVELLIGVAIVLILFAYGLPSFTLWLQNAQNRTAAEAVQNGLQFARSEAVRRNAVVRITFTNTSGLASWSIGCEKVTSDCPVTIQDGPAAAETPNARLGASVAAIPVPSPANPFAIALAAGAGLPAGVSFDGYGRIPAANLGTDISRIDITNASASAARRMVVTVSPGGRIRMCDPAVALSTSPTGCS